MIAFAHRLDGNCSLLSDGNLPGLSPVDCCPSDSQYASKPSLSETELAPDLLVLIRGHLCPHNRVNLVPFASSRLKLICSAFSNTVTSCMDSMLKIITSKKCRHISKIISNTRLKIFACCYVIAKTLLISNIIKTLTELLQGLKRLPKSLVILTKFVTGSNGQQGSFLTGHLGNLTHLLPKFLRVFAIRFKCGPPQSGIVFHSNTLLHCNQHPVNLKYNILLQWHQR